MSKLNRRDLMKMAPAAIAATTAVNSLPALAGADDPARAKVAVVKGLDLTKMTLQALEMVGGAKAYVSPGQKVFIKPNLVTAITARFSPVNRNGECTKPEIIMAMAEECLKAGAAEVVIGDGSQGPSWDWKYLLTFDGASNMADEAKRLNAKYGEKVRLVCLNADTPEWVEIPTKTALGTIPISSFVAKADVVISLPLMKTHSTCGLTLAMKNFVGVASSDRLGGYPFRGKLHRAGIEQSFIDIVAAVKPRLAIIDGSICCEGNGPSVNPSAGKGLTVDVKERLGHYIMLASADLVAVDATAARVMSHDPVSIPQFQLALAQNLGVMDEARIDLVGAKLEELRMPWLKSHPSGAFGRLT